MCSLVPGQAVQVGQKLTCLCVSAFRVCTNGSCCVKFSPSSEKTCAFRDFSQSTRTSWSCSAPNNTQTDPHTHTTRLKPVQFCSAVGVAAPAETWENRPRCACWEPGTASASVWTPSLLVFQVSLFVCFCFGPFPSLPVWDFQSGISGIKSWEVNERLDPSAPQSQGFVC